MAKKSIKKNYIYNLSYQILLLISPLITTPYVSRVLGADGIGTVSYVEAIAAYFVLLATFGISTYGQREISYVQDSVEKRSIIFWNTKILNIIFSMFAFVAYISFALMRDNPMIYVIYSLNILAVLVDVTWFFQGMEEFSKIVLRNAIFKIISIVYIFVFIHDKDDLLVYAFGVAFFIFVSNFSLWFYIPNYVRRVDKNQIHPFREFKIVLSLFIPTIAIQIYTVLDKTMIGIITQNSLENGYYEQALKVSRIVLSIVTALGTVMIPRIGYYYEQKNTEEVKRLMYRGYRFLWFLGVPLCLGVVTISSNFVPWFYGEGFEKVASLLKVLAFLILAIGINNVTGMQYLIPTKRQNIFTFTVIIGACTNFLMNLALIGKFQSIGGAIASVTAETVIAVFQMIIVRKELSPWRSILEGIHYYIAGTIMAIVLIFVGKTLHPSIANTVIMIVSGAFVYLGILVILKDEFLISNVKFVINIIKGK